MQTTFLIVVDIVVAHLWGELLRQLVLPTGGTLQQLARLALCNTGPELCLWLPSATGDAQAPTIANIANTTSVPPPVAQSFESEIAGWHRLPTLCAPNAAAIVT